MAADIGGDGREGGRKVSIGIVFSSAGPFIYTFFFFITSVFHALFSTPPRFVSSSFLFSFSLLPLIRPPSSSLLLFLLLLLHILYDFIFLVCEYNIYLIWNRNHQSPSLLLSPPSYYSPLPSVIPFPLILSPSPTAPH